MEIDSTTKVDEEVSRPGHQFRVLPGPNPWLMIGMQESIRALLGQPPVIPDHTVIFYGMANAETTETKHTAVYSGVSNHWVNIDRDGKTDTFEPDEMVHRLRSPRCSWVYVATERRLAK